MTELMWDGKYTPDGKRVSPVRVALPFQTVETVNESARQRQLALDYFTQGRESEWRNRLIWGDKKYVLPSLLPELAGKVDLIYIDPPFDTGADFSFTRTVPDSDASFTKEPSIIEQKAYRDTWGRGLDSYLQWFYETVALLHELLAETGSIYVHIGTNVSNYLKPILDQIFGSDRFVNEIVWKRQAAHSDSKQGSQHYGRLHDNILFYTKAEEYTWNQSYQPYDETYVSTFYANVDANGRRFQYGDLTGPGGSAKGNPVYEFLGVTRAWRYSRQKMQELYQQGRIEFRPGGKVPRLKRYLDEAPGMPVQDLWTDVSYGALINFGKENVGYPTQKPEALLERIIKASSNEGDLVLDCFCGSGTTAAVAEKLNRRWITCDLGRFAIQTTRKRLLSIDSVRPFVVQNLGKYERQAWQAAEFQGRLGDARGRLEAGAPSGHDAGRHGAGDPRGNEEAARQAAYRRFMLDLSGAEPLEGYAWLHGLKNGRFVHVGSVDAPLTAADVAAIARECWKAAGRPLGAPASSRHTLEANTLAPTSTVPTDAGRQAGPASANDSADLEAGGPRGYDGGRHDAGGRGDIGPRETTNAADVLGWDFAFEVNETAKAIAADANVRLAFKRIPREVLEKKAVEQGDVRFFELAALSLDVTQKGRDVTLALRDFLIPPDDVPADVQKAITHWSQWIDYWAVDWDFREDTFHNQWQSYRTKKDPKLQCSVAHTYEEPGSYTVVVKVIDILGNDTTKSVMVDVP